MSALMQMEKLYNKLIIFNYGEKFCKKYHINLIDKNYFFQNEKTGEQYITFVSLAVWLIKNIDPEYKISMPNESDDPNATLLGILKFISKHGINSDISTNKLKSGYGEQVINILANLADLCIIQQNIDWKHKNVPITYESNDLSKNEIIIHDEKEIEHYSDSTSSNTTEGEDESLERDDFISQSDPNHNNGMEVRKEELDSVVPNLKAMAVALDDINISGHNVKQLQDLYFGISNTFTNIEHSINSLLSKHANTLDVLKEKEKRFNSQIDTNFGDVKELNRNLRLMKGEFDAEEIEIANKNQTLDKLNLEVDRIRNEIRRKVDGMSDTTELNKSKKLVIQLKEEIFEMDVKINFLANTLQHSPMPF